MSKVYALISNDNNEDGFVKQVLCVSTNFRQLQFLMNKLEHCTNHKITLKKVFDYKASLAKNILALSAVSTDGFDFYQSEVKDFVFCLDQEKTDKILNQKISDLKKDFSYDDDYVEKDLFEIKSSLTRKDIQELFAEFNAI